MNWKLQIEEIEKDFGSHKKKNWASSVEILNMLLSEFPNDVELHIRAIYILHNILVEEPYSVDEGKALSSLLLKIFHESTSKYSENSQYLFFIGKILHIAEWYFGLKDTELALVFQKKAMEKEPDNILYEWAYRFSFPEDKISSYLANQIVKNDTKKISWLKSKGFPGEYILEHLIISSDNYLTLS